MINRIMVQEIRDLHAFLEAWLSGSTPPSRADFDQRFVDRLDPDFLNIQPGGLALDRDALAGQILAGYGLSPDFRIEVREFSIRLVSTDLALVTYREFQQGGRNSPSHNARLSTVLFRRQSHDRLTWFHIHETWLPLDIQNSKRNIGD